MIAHRPEAEIEIQGVPSSAWETALRILFARFSPEDMTERIAATMQAVAEGRLNLQGLRWALQDGLPVGAALIMEQPDGITLVWPPVVTCAALDADAVEHALMEDLTQRLDESSAKLAQILIDPQEVSDLSLYQRHGFTHQTELFFLARSLHEPFPSWELGLLQSERFDEAVNRERFVRVVEATYRQSRDCLWLEGLRTGAEALASHQLSGVWDPALWHLYQVEGRDVGVLLLNDHPDQDAVELVYFGVCPEFRGRGYGRVLMGQALVQAQARGRSLLFAAVDAANDYAHAIYAAAQFVELARRQALFRFPRGLARK